MSIASNRKKGARSRVESSLNISEIHEIAKLVEKYGFTEFEFENEKIRIRLSKSLPAQFISAIPTQTPTAAATSAVETKVSADSKEQAVQEKSDIEATLDDNLHKITSPIVGTFYRAPAPDKPPYVEVGDKVTPDTVVCIVEAMKLMNEIKAEVSGEVVKIYVENGQPVEYGQPLFGIKLS
ncbi:MAG: acetyl-CoA carboxylase biotin carboxyl carrier protein [Pyrinomonadaceae bacterium]|nr:acetyl-CoA carboxylase biotin carboxyl carrier protein [Pyrinomonadaceae bacterium]MCX7639353.1 acetyl-CoA carboxylase biotin carboxyl carrier protein [Pyrinomonadaceae bacterium]MDW8305231.1 acetyl-CoA carboxylase biotin carboxyl carrier protein [Acidobacteriota bacterium]